MTLKFESPRVPRWTRPASEPQAEGKGRPRGHRRAWRRAAVALSGLLVGLLVVAALGILAVIHSLPPPEGFGATPRTGIDVYAADGSPMGTRGVVHGRNVPLDRLPEHLPQAVLAMEDRRFRDHFGLDPVGMARALRVNIAAGSLRQGGSTITQQLAKNLYLTPERTILRKAQETVIALWLEQRLTKDEILERYLNSVYLGGGAYGVAAAAQRYFGAPAEELTLVQSAMLAGLIRAPSAYAPTRSLERARERAALALDAMVETGALTPDEAGAAKAAPAELARPPGAEPLHGHYLDWLAQDAHEMVGEVSGEFAVVGTVNETLQRLARDTLAEHLDEGAAALGAREGAIVSMLPDGAIVAMVGGLDYEASRFNRATQARRQPGSVFKVFVYLAALEAGWRTDDRIDDLPLLIGDWEPSNHDHEFRGTMSLREAFALSRNVPAVRLQEEVGRERVAATARSLGMRGALAPVPSLALGTDETTLLDLTAAFAALHRGVARVTPYGFRAVRTPRGNMLDRVPVQSPPAAWPQQPMLELLRAVVAEGTGRGAAVDKPAFGKTGTTQNHRDAWFVGFSGGLITGVWVGNDENEPMDGVTGGGLPARIWRDYMRSALAVDYELLASAPEPPAVELEPRREPVAGIPRLIDTGTLEIRGERIRLVGVNGLGGEHRREMGKYLAGREVDCQPEGRDRWRCHVGSYDLSEVVLFNGGGMAASDAPPDLREAQENAMRARRGIWAN